MELRRSVAVELPSKNHAGDEHAVARFERQMETIGRLSHPNIVLVHDARQIAGKPVLVIEDVEGLDLAELVGRHGPLPNAGACEVVREAAIGLQHTHEHGLIHRGIKPSNLMLNRHLSKTE